MHAYVIFEVGGVRYAAPVEQIREVLPWVTPTPLPGAPEGVLGVIKARGLTLPVLTVPERSGTGAPARGDDVQRRLLLAEVGGRQVAIAADTVVTVARVEPTAADAVPGPGSGITALVEVGDRPTLTVDLDTLMAPASGDLAPSV